MTSLTVAGDCWEHLPAWVIWLPQGARWRPVLETLCATKQLDPDELDRVCTSMHQRDGDEEQAVM